MGKLYENYRNGDFVTKLIKDSEYGNSRMRYTHLPVAFQMLANGYRLFDEVVQVFRDHRRQSFGFQDAEDLVAGDEAHLCNSVRVSQYYTCSTI